MMQQYATHAQIEGKGAPEGGSRGDNVAIIIANPSASANKPTHEVARKYYIRMKRKRIEINRKKTMTYSVVSFVTIGFNPSFFLFLLIAAAIASVTVAAVAVFDDPPFVAVVASVAVAVVIEGVDAVAIAGVIVGSGASSC